MYTLLEMVQIILSSMDSDEVTSINDTAESRQVALLIKGMYYDLATELDLPDHNTLFELTESGSGTQPVLMTLPSTIKKVNWIKYDTKKVGDTHTNYRTIYYMPLDRFQEYTQNQKEITGAASMNVTLNGDVFDFIHRTDKAPGYYTTLKDTTLVFDSYDASIDTYLTKTKTMCNGTIYPTFTLSDSFVPTLNYNQFSLLLNASKERAFVELKQGENINAVRETRRQRVIYQYQKRRNEDQEEIYKAPRYGKP